MEQEDRVCPECVSGKHVNCTGEAWDFAADGPTPCECPTCGNMKGSNA